MLNIEFATVLHCIDGRVQLPVFYYLQERFGVPYIDLITEAGMVRHIADPLENPVKLATFESLKISMDRHGSRQVALVAHEDCAGNPTTQAIQEEQLRLGLHQLERNFPGMERLGIWCPLEGAIQEIL